MRHFPSEEKIRYYFLIMKYMDGIRIAGWAGFLLYLGGLAYLMFFADLWGRTVLAEGYSYNLVPFCEIRRYLLYWHKIGLFRVFLNLGGNILGFMPFGFCIPLLFRYHRTVPVILLCSFLFSLSIELIQLVTRVGSCDVDDILLNTLGGLLGYWLFLFLRDIRRKRLVVRGTETESVSEILE